MATTSAKRIRIWNTIASLAAGVLVCTLVITLWEPVSWWLQGEEKYDEAALEEWVQEARIQRSLPELVDEYLEKVTEERERLKKQNQTGSPFVILDPLGEVKNARKDIHDFLRALCEPVTKTYSGQLPLFPAIYQLKITFDEEWDLPPIVWDSELPRQKEQFRTSRAIPIGDRGVQVQMSYRLRVYAYNQYSEKEEAARRLRLSGLATIMISLVLGWVYLAHRREKERQKQSYVAEQQVNEAERRRLEEQLKRREAEQLHEELERANLELKSQLWANIGIMAGSYAHNIKNLLVRPNDLLARSMEMPGLPREQSHMLTEVRQTLGTVTERLQQILHTVQRDPTETHQERLDLNVILRQLADTWKELAREKWKIDLSLDLSEDPMWIDGDRSHLQQAFENLIFNARDATFEKRTQLREEARNSRSDNGLNAQSKKQGLIAAASWVGEIHLRTNGGEQGVSFEIRDNGIGMTEEVKAQCTQTHFSTKRNNAQFAGMTAGMGLGLSFVMVILEHHQATMEIESQPGQGALFRVMFPPVTATNVDGQ